MAKQKKKKESTGKMTFMAYIGFYAGLIWGGLKIIEYGLKLTKITPAFLVEPFYKHAFLDTWPGMMIGWCAFILFSIIGAFVYMSVFRKISGPWMGLGYGIIWWVLIYLLIGPYSGMTPTVYTMDLNSFITDFCLFLLWGLFIGYSISFEFTDEQEREPALG